MQYKGVTKIICHICRSENSEEEKDEAVDVNQAVSAMAHASNLEVIADLFYCPKINKIYK